MEKTSSFLIRISQDELDSIKTKAAASKVSVSAYMRMAAVGQELPPQIVGLEGLQEYNRQLQKLGNNLNQLVMLCNTGRYPYPRQIEPVLAEAAKAVRDTWPLLSSFAPVKRSIHSGK